MDTLEKKIDLLDLSLQKILASLGSVAGTQVVSQGQVAIPPTGQAPHPDLHPEMAKAIDQLDAVRKHMMNRFDNEMLLLRRTSPDVPTLKQAASTELETHQILSKLNQITSQLQSLKPS
jgi:hypothetical protein